MRPKVSIIEANDSHAEILADFYRKTWNPEATAEEVLASRRIAATGNVSEPGVVPPTFIAVQDDQVLGYCSSLPLRLSDGHDEHPAYWAKGLMVLPEFRSGPIGFAVLKELVRSRDLVAAVTVAEGSKRLFGALGFHDFGAIPNWIRPTRFRLAASQFRPQLLDLPPKWRALASMLELARKTGATPAVGALVDTLAKVSRRASGPGTVVEQVRELGEAELNGLWSRVRQHVGAGPVRDFAAWSERYLQNGLPYIALAHKTDGKLDGVLLLRIPRADPDPRAAGLRFASISDLLVDPAGAGARSLLLAAEMVAAAHGAGAVIITASNRRLQSTVQGAGYIRRAGNIHFFLKAEKDTAPWPSVMEDWWLLRGDGESDGSF